MKSDEAIWRAALIKSWSHENDKRTLWKGSSNSADSTTVSGKEVHMMAQDQNQSPNQTAEKE